MDVKWYKCTNEINYDGERRTTNECWVLASVIPSILSQLRRSGPEPSLPLLARVPA